MTRWLFRLFYNSFFCFGTVVKFLSPCTSEEIWKDSTKKIKWFKNLGTCFYDIMHMSKHAYENMKTKANFDYGIMPKRKAHPALRAEPPFFFFLIEKELGIKIGSTWIAPILWTQTSESNQSILFSNWFFHCKHPFIEKQQERIKGTEKASPIHTLFHR